MGDKNISPEGWYVGRYLLRFVELEDAQINDPEARFLSWENTVLVQADNLDHVYDKIIAIATDASAPYSGGKQGIPVQWEFVGVTEILPIYEKLEDGCEIMWTEHAPRKLKNLRSRIRQRGEFDQ